MKIHYLRLPGIGSILYTSHRASGPLLLPQLSRSSSGELIVNLGNREVIVAPWRVAREVR